jgi:hypothetical protein
MNPGFLGDCLATMRQKTAVLTNSAKAVYLSSNLAKTDFQPLVKKTGG